MTEACGAKKRQSPGTCQKTAGWGTAHPGAGRCRLHGGATAAQTKHAAEAAIEAQARRELARLNVTPVENPLQELQRLAGRVLAWEETIGTLVNQLTTIRYRGGEGGTEQLRAEVALLERAMDRCASVLTAMARLDIDERLARVTEAQTALVADALAAVLRDAGLSAEEQRDVRLRLSRRLRAVEMPGGRSEVSHG